jgi:hypothetical protein
MAPTTVVSLFQFRNMIIERDDGKGDVEDIHFHCPLRIRKLRKAEK